MIIDWNNIMPAAATTTINAATNVAGAANIQNLQWSGTINAVFSIFTWNYSFLTGNWVWLRIIGAAFTFAMIWPILQLLVYAIGSIISGLKGIGIH